MKRLGARPVLSAILVILAISACDAASSPSPSSPASPSPTIATGSPVPASPEPASASPSAPPADSSAPAQLTLGGTWVKPRDGARITSTATTLAAKPAASGPGTTTFTRVVFRAAATGVASRTLCKASRPDEDGVWRCRADLLARGIPPGELTFTFDVQGVGVPAAISPDGPRQVTYAVAPPRPTDTRIHETGARKTGRYERTHTFKVEWSSPAGYADEFLVYQTQECPTKSTEQNEGKPCFGPGTPVDGSQLTLLAKAPGDARSVRIQVPEAIGGCDIGSYLGSILLRARNAHGESTFAIVESDRVLWFGPGDMPC
jgi:hypothetical protein